MSLPVRWDFFQKPRGRAPYGTASFGSNNLKRLPKKVGRLGKKLYYRQVARGVKARIGGPEGVAYRHEFMRQAMTGRQLRGLDPVDITNPTFKRKVRQSAFKHVNDTYANNASIAGQTLGSAAVIGGVALATHKSKLNDRWKNMIYGGLSSMAGGQVGGLAGYAGVLHFSKYAKRPEHAMIMGVLGPTIGARLGAITGEAVYHKYKSQKYKDIDKKDREEAAKQRAAMIKSLKRFGNKVRNKFKRKK